MLHLPSIEAMSLTAYRLAPSYEEDGYLVETWVPFTVAHELVPAVPLVVFS